MKIRCGFVSNSSDASFVIPLDRLTPLQVEAIKRHCALGEMLGIPWSEDWFVIVENGYIAGSTLMDDFDMDKLFDFIGVEERTVYRHSHSGNWRKAVPPDWDEGDAIKLVNKMEITTYHEIPRIELKYAMTDEAFFAEFLKHQDFESLDKLAGKSALVRKLLSDPNFKVCSDE